MISQARQFGGPPMHLWTESHTLFTLDCSLWGKHLHVHSCARLSKGS